MINKSVVKDFVSLRKSKIISINGVNKRAKVRTWSAVLPVCLPNLSVTNVNFHVCKDLKIPYNNRDSGSIRGFCDAHDITLSPNSIVNFPSSNFHIEAIIGTDMLHLFEPFTIISKFGYHFIQLANGVLPITSTDANVNSVVSCISSNLISSLNNSHTANCKRANIKRCRVIERKNDRISPIIATALSPPENRLISPIETLFSDSTVEQGLENFFHIDSAEIFPRCRPRDEDSNALRNFENTISLIDGHYHIELPWRSKVLDEVPHNLGICKNVAKRVYEKTVQSGHAEQYWNIFADMQAEGMIEPLPKNFDLASHKFVTHRPVFRESSLNTKCRPVFNCSLKVRGKPSLNEAACLTPDLMSVLLELLFYFRCNNHALLADLRKAFLMIKLKKPSDRNCFSFCLYFNDKFYYYRFASVLFGYVNSPYFLNFILKVHAKKYS